MAHWQPRFTAADAAIIKQQRICDGFFKISRLTIRHSLFEGGEVEIVREQFQRGAAVCDLLFDTDKEGVELVEQFRVGALGKRDKHGRASCRDRREVGGGGGGGQRGQGGGVRNRR